MPNPNNYQIVLQPTTAATYSASFSPSGGNSTVVLVSGLQGSEIAVLQVYNPLSANPNNFDDCPLYIITATSNPLLNGFLDAGTYRIRKTATAAAVGVAIIQNINTSTIQLGG